MAFDAMPGGDPHGPWCTACRQPIRKNQKATRVEFQNDPQGLKGLTGTYHLECSRPFQSIARVLNMNLWGKF